MKHAQYSTPMQLDPFLHQVRRWPLALRRLHQQIASCFVRPEPRQHALLYLQAILSDLPRKNGWQIAEHARLAHPYGMQRLLSQAVWGQDAVRDQLRTALLESLSAPSPADPSAQATPFPVLVIDESGFPKRGKHSAGVAPQYCGNTGRAENCQVGVFLSYVTALGHGLLDRELYLPQEWCEDPARRQAAHIPDTVRFRTKPELARLMVERTKSAPSTKASKQRSAVANRAPVVKAVPAKPPAQPKHVIARVEYAGNAGYVVIDPSKGVLPFAPESPAWFAWLGEQSSFRFVGKEGYFSAHHWWRASEGAWRGHRQLRNHTRSLRLAPTNERPDGGRLRTSRGPVPGPVEVTARLLWGFERASLILSLKKCNCSVCWHFMLLSYRYYLSRPSILDRLRMVRLNSTIRSHLQCYSNVAKCFII